MNKKIKVKVSTKMSITFALIIIVTALLFYYIMPILLNYAPDSINTQFDKEVSGIYYKYQYLAAIIVIIVMFSIYSKITLRKLDKWVQEQNNENILEIRKMCFTYPYKMFLTIEMLPVICVLLILTLTGSHREIMLFKIGILVFAFATLVSSMFLIISKNIFYPILKKTSEYVKDEKAKKRKSLRTRLIFQTFPIILVSVLLIALIGYSRIIAEKGDLLNTYYSLELESIIIEDNIDILEQLEKQIGDELLNPNDYIFVKTPSGQILTSKEFKPSEFFVKYMNKLSETHNNRVYESYAVDERGVITKVEYNNQEYIVGIHYEIVVSSLLMYFLIATILLFVFDLIILNYIVKSMNSDLEKITDGMQEILNSSDKIDNKELPVTSDDIIGELVESFNEIQEMTKKNIKEIHSNQDILMERERLAALGQLIGGIAHNLKTPIMSIAGAVQGLENLIVEYDTSIDDPLVNSQDHHDIAKDMKSWLPKIRTHLEYMSDIITTVKGQAVALSNNDDDSFTVAELVKRVNILMKHELKNAYIYLNVIMNTDENQKLQGNVNSLVQVVNNIISNAIQAYGGKHDQNIELKVKKENNSIVFSITDFAGGLPKEVQDKLFKEMITTKGKNGTGLGMYMSYSNIKAHFRGDITYETEIGNGTTFNIIIPIKK